MYLDYFGLQRPPFKITPDASMFYTGGARGNALDALIYAILNGEGIVKVVGEVGSGKTMLCRMLELKLPQEVEIVYIANPNISPEHILHTIAIELEINVDESSSRLEVMQKLQHFLLERHQSGYQIVVFVEEAQGMPIETLEEIRLMSNLETDHDKLLQIVLFGQPELDHNLTQPEIRQLKERITHSFFLSPFTPDEVHKYLNFRMTIAGYHGPDIFPQQIANLICKHTGGLLRRINIISDKALLGAFAEQTHNISKKHVIAAVNDSEFSTIKSGSKTHKLLISALAASLCVIAVLIFTKIGNIQFNNAPNQQLEKTVLSQTVANQKNLNPQDNKTTADKIIPKGDSVELKNNSPISQNTPNKATASTKVQPPTKSLAKTSQIEDKTLASTTNSSQKQQTKSQRSNLSNLQKRIIATNEWLKTNNPDLYTIQLMSIKNRHINHLHKYLLNLSEENILDNIYIYKTGSGDNSLFGVLYQNFSSKRNANAALSALPTILNANSPVLRTIRGINGEISRSYGSTRDQI